MSCRYISLRVLYQMYNFKFIFISKAKTQNKCRLFMLSKLWTIHIIWLDFGSRCQQASNGVQLTATERGWDLKKGRYGSVYCEKQPAPPNILSVSCNCKRAIRYERNCQCRCYGLHSTKMCGHCAGHGWAHCASCNEHDCADIII